MASAPAMGASDICLLHGHGVAVAGPSVEASVVTTDTLDTLLRMTVDLARLGAEPAAVPPHPLLETSLQPRPGALYLGGLRRSRAPR